MSPLSEWGGKKEQTCLKERSRNVLFSFSYFVGERLSGASIWKCSVPFAAVSPHSSCGFVEEPKAGLLLTGPEEDFL